MRSVVKVVRLSDNPSLTVAYLAVNHTGLNFEVATNLNKKPRQMPGLFLLTLGKSRNLVFYPSKQTPDFISQQIANDLYRVAHDPHDRNDRTRNQCDRYYELNNTEKIADHYG
jgi:hypothetical protein